MKDIQFNWDPDKAELNIKNHDISFTEATTVFDDDAARLIFDPDHSAREDRFILLGISCTLKILVVVHCYLEEESIIRIISARKATKSEEKKYREFLS